MIRPRFVMRPVVMVMPFRLAWPANLIAAVIVGR
jgi:hypothetical protein